MIGKIPIYLQIYGNLRKAIELNEYLPGQLLPSEPELEKRYGVSRITVRRAIELLANDGYVSAKQGVGTIVAYPSMQKPSYVTSFSEMLSENGYNPSSKNIHLSFVQPSKDIIDLMGSPGLSELVCIQRLQLADEEPIGIMTNYIRPEAVPGIEARELNFTSLYAFLEREYHIIINTSRDIITARVADLAQAAMLKISVGSPLIFLKRISFADGYPILVDVVYINAYKHSFSFNLVGRPPILYDNLKKTPGQPGS
jgi:GntR family transcriptional regulator